MLHLKSKVKELTDEGIVIWAGNPFKCDHESWVEDYSMLIGQSALIDKKRYKIITVEGTSLHGGARDSDEVIKLLVYEA